MLLAATLRPQASGDAGTGKQGMFKCKAFDATYPASSPFVTAVGGTYLDKDTKVEHGWSDSGGGFSAVFGRPAYQEPAVAAYLGSGVVPKATAPLYNASGRALPDVSALSTNFQICSSGAYGPLSGTSAVRALALSTIRVQSGRSEAFLRVCTAFVSRRSASAFISAPA